MLVFGRKQGEAVAIGENIQVWIREIHGGRAKIGIEAPDRVVIRRKELPGHVDASNRSRPAEE